jgi:hypothetical protein
LVALESTALSLAKTIVRKAASAWIADRHTAEERKKELSALLTSKFRYAAAQRFLNEAASELASFGRNEFRGLDDGERAAALLAVGDAFERADLTDRALFAADVDAAKLASRLRAGQPRAKTAAGLGEVGGAFYDAALDRSCELYVRAVVQVPTFVGRSLAEMLNRLSDLPDQVADRVVSAWGEAQAASADLDSGVRVAGRSLEEVTDPFALEVHRPVQPEEAPAELPVLPPYVPREHDQVLGHVVRAAAAGRSGIAVLVGGSSTGKTRACWEALALLRDQDPPWRLWHPIDPSRPDAALREVPGIGPRTVVWLNEAQFYLDVGEAGLGERVAAGLRELLRDPGRSPVLVLATVWPQFWAALTARPDRGADPHAQARELLAGHDITVPAAFTPAQVGQLTRAEDVRIVLAARSALDGEVIQFLAGAPELLARYRNAPPAARALIHAAMDARRLGIGIGLPQALLEAAAPGYLTDTEWDLLAEDWLEQALAYAAVSCKGARGPLTRIRPRPARSATRSSGDQADSMAVAAGPPYRLADYLDQHGRAQRASQTPPAEFWSAAVHAAPADQAALGAAADARGLYRDAAQLCKNAAASGNARAVLYLSAPPACLSTDPRPVHWAVAHAALDDPHNVADLLDYLRAGAAHEQAAALLARDPAAHVALDDPVGVARLLDSLRKVGAHEQAATLLARDPAAHAALDEPARRGPAGARGGGGGARAARRGPARARSRGVGDPAAHLPLDNPGSVAGQLYFLLGAGQHEQTAALLARDPAAHVALDDPRDVGSLLDSLWEAGAHEQVTTLADRAAAHAALDDPVGVAGLLGRLRDVGAHEQVTTLADRAAAHAALDDPGGVAFLLDDLREVGAHGQAAALLARDPAAHVALDHQGGVAFLLDSLRKAGAHEQVTSLADRAAAHAALDDPGGVALLLDSLREAGMHGQAAALLARDPAAHAALDQGISAAILLDSLRKAGAHEQVTTLADRAAAHVALEDPGNVSQLLGGLQRAGAYEQAAKLVGRLPDGGLFRLFLKQTGLADQFRFGREADGTPATPWGWEDLDLWLVPRPVGTMRRPCPSAYRRLRRIRKVSADSSLSGRPELHCEAQLSAPAPRSLHLDGTKDFVTDQWWKGCRTDDRNQHV